MMNDSIKRHIYLAWPAVFIIAVIVIQLVPVAAGLMLAALILGCCILVQREQSYLLLTTGIYMLGFEAAEFAKAGILGYADQSRELEIVLSRFSLLGFVVPLWIYKRILAPKTDYFTIGSFTNTIQTPPVSWGIKDPIWRFLLIASAIICAGFSFVIDFGREDLGRLLLYGMCFALVNAVLEELLWRGLILPRMIDFCGERMGLVFSSVAFGCYHYSIGFPWTICALFSLCGMMMGNVAIRSKGLLPIILLHVLMNILFALAGIIF
ncbi:CPBP family intramembrane glutamic endopeptidase [Paenibacillus sedimenti]|uniref:CPBP family intramembrane metalloprotease n=1 Tax=Paenibacillus sedimenti TaxID=2770274 RepID=A0A926QIS4_9BACL|nr:CPBP family intramembrane glutamic endopeptidase [Paenibacillus sedimenti]MBD0379918.1 CPBP family intramembrane metalloprotease [Paenibacillus sedimenti]